MGPLDSKDTSRQQVCSRIKELTQEGFVNVGSLPGGAVVDPGPGCVGWSPDVVFVVPLPDIRMF